MKLGIGVFGTVGLLLLFAAPPVHAQARNFHVGLGGGVSFPLGEIGDEFEAGLHLNGLLQTGTLGALPLGLRGEVGYQRFSHDDDLLRHISGRVNAVLPFAARPDAQPYLIGGLGVYNSKEEIEHGDHFDERSETFLGVNVGLGIRWQLGGLNTFVEARFENIFDDQHAQRIIPFSLGILF